MEQISTYTVIYVDDLSISYEYFLKLISRVLEKQELDFPLIDVTTR